MQISLLESNPYMAYEIMLFEKDLLSTLEHMTNGTIERHLKMENIPSPSLGFVNTFFEP